MPTRASAERWKRVDLAYRTGRDLPSVALCKLGDDYYVVDGNHRVSVARFDGVEMIDADVTEFFPSRTTTRRRRHSVERIDPPGKEHTRMEVLVVLSVSFVLMRVVGLLGVERLASWRSAGLRALAIMFLVTSTAHFNGMRHDLVVMIPEPLPDGLWIVYLTGVFEIAGAVGLLVPRTRRLAGIGLALLLIAQFPANVNAALNGIPLGGEAPTPLWLRTPMQLLFIAMVWWTSITARPGEAQRQPTLLAGAWMAPAMRASRPAAMRGSGARNGPSSNGAEGVE
jgi:uncharacterized membrane protein